MERRGQRTTIQERAVIGEFAAVGQTDAATAAMLGCSIWTVRKWRRAAARSQPAQEGRRPGRPSTGPLGTAPVRLRDHIRQLRERHPGWGAETILGELRADPLWAATRLPSRSRIALFLKEAGLTRRYQRHSRLPQPAATEALCPHDTWQLDAQGVALVAGVGRTCLITGIDVASRLKVESFPSVGTTNPPTEDYFLALRRAFLAYGLPRCVSLDHGTVFYDNTTPSPFPTRLHLWLMALGVHVRFIRKSRPTDHGIVERAHQVMGRQAVEGQTWSDQNALWNGLDQRRERLNSVLPTIALGHQAPLQADPTAAFSGRAYRPEWEEALLDLDRVYRYLGEGRWFRQIKPNGRIKIGGYQYYLGLRLAGSEVTITFDPSMGMLVCHPEGKSVAIAVPIQGLGKSDLMGELAGFARLPAYQLALPFFPDASRQQCYATALAGTN